MTPAVANPVVHLELHTCDVPRACDFYEQLFTWRIETLRVGRDPYVAFDPGQGIQGGLVEINTELGSWLPYVEVADVADAAELGRSLGASVVLEPREGPAGWHSTLVAPDGAQVALWQPKA
jgi:predicted enzyme related to lactoylglutathione lyase